MKAIISKPYLLFFIIVFIIALPLCIFPINLFSGEIVLQSGIQELVIERPLSLSYFFGLGMNEGDLIGVKDFYLVTKGWLTVVIFLVGFPFLISYRVYLHQNKENNNKPLDQKSK